MQNYELRVINLSAYVPPSKEARGMFSDKRRIFFKLLIPLLFLVLGLEANAQVSATIDSTSIKIGEEIRYKMQVEASANQIVVFPEGQTFSPLEMIESFAIDTARNADKLSLTKEYSLTQFDSGYYTIPRQKILIGDRTLFTDSLKIEVRDVVVDTTKQKMYEIKPLQEVDSSFSNWKKYVWWILIPLLLIVSIALILFRRKKIKIRKEKEELPPYEKAIKALHEIDESHLLEQESYKEYYSRLSDTARRYIDEEIYDHALESTTDELIERLDQEIKSGFLNLDKHTIEELKSVLKTADMAKFAKSRPDVGTAKADRNVIERVITETKEAIPEPTEEELLADEEYRLEREKKIKCRRIIIGSVAAFLIIFFTVIGFGLYWGFDVLKDNVLGHPTKELAEGDWISSTYGSPPVTISTPKVLIRNNFQLTEEMQQVLKDNETFVYGSLMGSFFVSVSTVHYNEGIQVDLEKAVEGSIRGMEAQGAKNITFKTDEYETLRGAKGLKVFGDMEINNPITKNKTTATYSGLYFSESGGFQQIIVVYSKEDRYAKDVAERIINSVELKNAD